MIDRLFEPWRTAFREIIREPSVASPLKDASLAGDLTAWTTSLTAAVVAACQKCDWQATAKKHSSRVLPQSGQEFLGIDVMAFPSGQTIEATLQSWPLPLAAFELENVPKQERIEYSLWKVLCLRTRLRVVFAYRSDWEQANQLVHAMGDTVIGRMTIEEREAIHGETAVIIGGRNEGETFPHGFFKYWLLNTNSGQFEKV